MSKLPDPRENPDYVIAEAAEEYMKPIKDIASELGITEEELLLHGHYVAKVDFKKLLDRLKDQTLTASTSTSPPSPPPPWERASPPPPWVWSRAWASARST